MATCEIIADPDSTTGFEFRGDNLEMMRSRDPQVILAGPRDTGKTISNCVKLHLICSRYARAQCGIVRKLYSDMPGTVLQTFEEVSRGFCIPIGGVFPTRYIYKNGSVVWVGGLDRPGKVLSSQRDAIFICQAEQLTLDDWETISGCTTGRGAVIPYPQLMGDCNPAGSKHWIKTLARSGKLRFLEAQHSDNPQLFEKLTEPEFRERFHSGYRRPTEVLQHPSLVDDIIEQVAVRRRDGFVYILKLAGWKRLRPLASHTGVRFQRLFKGLWVTAEGVVYEGFDSTPGGPHVRERDPNEMKHFYLAMDEGGTNPQVCLLVGVDADSRWHVFREFYVTKRNESEIVAQAKCWFEDVTAFGEVRVPYRLGSVSGEYTIQGAGLPVIRNGVPTRCEECAVDAAAAGLIKALNDVGVPARGGKGEILDGIHKIQDRLVVQPFDGRARLTVSQCCENTIAEFESYIWKPEKDVPVDKDNHSLGALRYLEDLFAEPTGAVDDSTADGIRIGQADMGFDEPLILT